MGKGIVRVSYDLLASVLCLPEGTEILAIQDGTTGIRFSGAWWIDMKLSHPDLPEREDGEMITRHDPQFSNEPVDGEHIETHFISWD